MKAQRGENVGGVLLEALAASDAVEEVPASPFVAEVEQTEHPTLVGRVLVTQPTNWAELVVTGVIDGFATRPEPERTGPALSLLPDERIRITDAAGAPLLDVVPGDDGPVLKLLTRDLNLDVDGKLRIRARDLELQARAGGVHVEARDAVVVKGETIDLN